MSTVLIGYFPKRRTEPHEWLAGTAAREICSVSLCLAPGPPDWIESWIHNDWACFNSPEEAVSVIPADDAEFCIYAWSLVARRFEQGEQIKIPLSAENVSPLPADFECLGFDVVSKTASFTFECSPLSCNNMAQEIAVNEFCLLDDLQDALSAALRFSVEEPEPGPYYVVQVHRLAR